MKKCIWGAEKVCGIGCFSGVQQWRKWISTGVDRMRRKSMRSRSGNEIVSSARKPRNIEPTRYIPALGPVQEICSGEENIGNKGNKQANFQNVFVRTEKKRYKGGGLGEVMF